MSIFNAFDVMLPEKLTRTWPVIACDQFTSEPEYWERVSGCVKNDISTLRLVFPEAFFSKGSKEDRIRSINETMLHYVNGDVFRTYKNAYVYVERTLKNGMIRRGLVGVIDLERYDYEAKSTAAIRATEKTVSERIPPRVAIRKDAELELSHVLMLSDDVKDTILATAEALKGDSNKLYEFDLLEEGGHIVGWLIEGKAKKALDAAIEAYEVSVEKKARERKLLAMVYAVGDGNHSLATAKTIYENLKRVSKDESVKTDPARYAMVELENIHDASQQFEPIHRVMSGVDVNVLLKALEGICSPDGIPVRWYSVGESGTVLLNPRLGVLAIQILQNFLDDYMKTHAGAIDYIHGTESLKKLSQHENCIGFELPAIEKKDFFLGIQSDGVLPRKTFSMGHGVEKRYYLEARRIKG